MDKKDKIDSVIELVSNGPMIIKGSFEITKPDGTKLTFTTEQMEAGVAMCRCGKSSDKPLCDGSQGR